MELAQQVQVSLLPLDESRLNQRRSKRIGSSIITSHSDDNDEEYISKRLLNRRSTPRYRHCYTPKPRIMIDKNEPRLSTSNSNKNQDAGIWVMKFLFSNFSFSFLFFLLVTSNSLLYITS